MLPKILTPEVLFILNSLENCGYKSRIVGGAVRNFLLNAEISDIDIATTALPDETQNVFAHLNIPAIPTGKTYGTITVVYNKKSYEITTLRKDVKTFGRQAEVSFSKSFEEDSNRRDFTINAIYMDKNGNLFDYHNGISDLKNKEIKFIGNPEKRIREDYLRVFRYFRFVAYYGDFKTNDAYLSIIHSLKEKIRIVSIERVVSEEMRILALREAHRIMPQMSEILNELFDLKDDALALCEKINIRLNALDRFSMILKFSNIPPADLIKKYSFQKDIKQRILLQCDQTEIEQIKSKIKTIRDELREFFVKYVVLKMYADNINRAHLDEIRDDLMKYAKSEYVNFDFRAADLAEYKLQKSQLEEIMMQTKKFWESGNYISKNDCFSYAVSLIKSR